MSKVAVLDTNKQVLEPCHPAVARKLLKRGEAAVFKRYPFTIILKREVMPLQNKAKPHQLCIDPGSKTTGIAIVDKDRNIVFAAELEHRGAAIKKNLQTRAGSVEGVVHGICVTANRVGRTVNVLSPSLKTASGLCAVLASRRR